MSTNDPKANVKELLLEDYRILADTLWKNEQTGETRVNWYIGIVTATVGGLVGLTSSEHRPPAASLRLIFLASFLALLTFGIVTLLRIMKRNATTDGYKKDSEAIRQMFQEHFNHERILSVYSPFGGSDNKGVARKFGGLAHTVLMINSLLVGGLAAASILPSPVPLVFDRQLVATCLVAVGAFAGALIGQSRWVRRVDERAKSELRTQPSHAGGVVFRMGTGGPDYCLIRSKKPPIEWVLPKGHIDTGEEYWQTAMREVREETGAFTWLVSAIDTDQYWIGDKKVVVRFYLMKFASEGTPTEQRNPEWHSYEQALELLTHPSSQNILVKAEQIRQEISLAESNLQSK